jgi:hypothetical protein
MSDISERLTMMSISLLCGFHGSSVLVVLSASTSALGGRLAVKVEVVLPENRFSDRGVEQATMLESEEIDGLGVSLPKC